MGDVATNNQSFNVQGVQVEVDGGYEGPNSLLILEAKSSTRDTFNIRQLAYPFRHFRTVVQKPIRSVVVLFSNGRHYFTEVVFGAGPDYYDFRIGASIAYEIVASVAPSFTLAGALAVPTVIPSHVTLPQANDVDKLIDLGILLTSGTETRESVAAHFEFDERQSDYYGNALTYLGFANRPGPNAFFSLTPEGAAVMSIQDRTTRNQRVAMAMLCTVLFNDLVSRWLSANQLPSRAEIQAVITAHVAAHTAVVPFIGGDTLGRRAASAEGWLRWLELNVSP